LLDLFKIPKLYWYRFVLLTLQPFYVKFFKLKGVGLEKLPKKGPFLVVANHSHLLDPFFIGALIKRPVFQMASNEFFRKPLMRRFMWAMGAFPRKKGFVDFKAIKHAIHLVRKGFPLIIYPEGGRNWDGETLPILKSTAKLVKLLGVPLVTVVSRGNYIAYPRWAKKRRCCRITIYYSEPVTFDNNTPDNKIIDYIQQGIYNNDNFTKIKKVRGKNPAHGLPRLLWRCPDCRTIDALREKDGHFIYCSNCGMVWEVNLNCYMRVKGESVWRAIKEYSDCMFRENEIVPIGKEELENFNGIENSEELFLKSKKVILYHEPYYPRLEKIGPGRLFLTGKKLIFIPDDGSRPYLYPFEDIRGRSTEQNDFFQIVLNHDIARFQMLEESCYKWELIYDYIRKKGGFREEEE